MTSEFEDNMKNASVILFRFYLHAYIECQKQELIAATSCMEETLATLLTCCGGMESEW